MPSILLAVGDALGMEVAHVCSALVLNMGAISPISLSLHCRLCSIQSHQQPAGHRLLQLHPGHLQLPPGDGGAGGGAAHHAGRCHHPAD